MIAKRRQLGFPVTLVSLLILLLMAGVGCSPADAHGVGEIELSTAALDFGMIPNSHAVSLTVDIRNVGQQRLEILGVSTSCACTKAEVASRHLAPGEATDLAVTYDPRVHDGATGEFVRVVYVRSNDADTPEAAVTVRVKVVETAEFGVDGRRLRGRGGQGVRQP